MCCFGMSNLRARNPDVYLTLHHEIERFSPLLNGLNAVCDALSSIPDLTLNGAMVVVNHEHASTTSSFRQVAPDAAKINNHRSSYRAYLIG